jgi:hypothetical protein
MRKNSEIAENKKAYLSEFAEKNLNKLSREQLLRQIGFMTVEIDRVQRKMGKRYGSYAAYKAQNNRDDVWFELKEDRRQLKGLLYVWERRFG